MSTEGMRRIETIHRNKISRRLEEIEQLIWADHELIPDCTFAETMEHLELSQAKKLKYKPIGEGRRWGKKWGSGWSRLRIRIPESFAGETVSLLFEPDGESVVFRDGKPAQGLDLGRHEYILLDKAKGGERIELYVETGAYGPFAYRGKPFVKRTYSLPRIARRIGEAWDAYHDLLNLDGIIDHLPQDDTRRAQLIFELERAVDLFDYNDTSVQARRTSARRLRKALKPLYGARANHSAPTVGVMGHAHLDVAWLWPLVESERKAGRTFANVLNLMERYPAFVFVQSQAILYEMIRKKYPDLYKRVRERIRGGRWSVTGGMWVEPDCNIPCGESLVRQLLVGTGFFRKEFGVEQKTAWIPDTFGFPACLPQLFKRSGMDYFFTQKLSWNQVTNFPYESFYWEGLDGSRVLTHCTPARTYNGLLSAEELRRAESAYMQKDCSSNFMIPFGRGDGGGGPVPEMLERLDRYANLEGVPKIKTMTPDGFFKRLEKEGEHLPLWVGELYLEYHRGTLTTHAAVKKGNRLCEIRLREVEMLAAINSLHGKAYPAAELDSIWKTVLLNQFHDILPGSSITEVYEQTAQDYDRLLGEIHDLRDQVLREYARRIPAAKGPGKGLLLFNSLSWPRSGVVEIDKKLLPKGKDLVASIPGSADTPVQVGCDGKARFLAELPATGHAACRIRAGKAAGKTIQASSRRLENDLLRVEFDAKGRITRILDKRCKRETLPKKALANQFLLYEDKPLTYDAWDIDMYFDKKLIESDGVLRGAKVVESGPVRSVIRFERTISNSRIVQDVALPADTARLDFNTRIEWNEEKDVLLKTAFPLAVRSDTARFETQFGHVCRPTHRNLPRDRAQFETPMQRWVDLSETGYGIALLNDCKYGCDARGNVVRLSLVRAPKVPDPTADINRVHEFSYAVLPHMGSFDERVVQAGYEFNMPVLAQPSSGSGMAGGEEANFAISAGNVILDTVKGAEDGNGIILRLYESAGANTEAKLALRIPAATAHETDLMERKERKLALRKGEVKLAFRPFQIRTLRIEA